MKRMAVRMQGQGVEGASEHEKVQLSMGNCSCHKCKPVAKSLNCDHMTVGALQWPKL